MGPSTRSASRAIKTGLSASRGSNSEVKAVQAKQKSVKQGVKTESSTVDKKKKPSKDSESSIRSDDANLAEKKWQSWSQHATSTPFPDFGHPTASECKAAHQVLHEMHYEAVEKEFEDPDTPETIANVLDAMIIAVLSQATSWSNAKRAMKGLRDTYGSIFNYDDIKKRGMETLQQAMKPGGLHIRKSMIIMSILDEVQQRHGSWDLNFLLEKSDEEAMEELIKYKYIGSKSAFVVMGWCLKRNTFTVDTHVYRIAGLWGWRPKDASKEKAQSHLDAVIPKEYKFDLHFLILQHGRVCPVCRGGSKVGGICDAQKKMKLLLKEEGE